MLLRNLVRPLAVSAVAAAVGYFLFGGPVVYWVIGAWIASIPVTVVWVWILPEKKGQDPEENRKPWSRVRR